MRWSSPYFSTLFLIYHAFSHPPTSSSPLCCSYHDFLCLLCELFLQHLAVNVLLVRHVYSQVLNCSSILLIKAFTFNVWLYIFIVRIYNDSVTATNGINIFKRLTLIDKKRQSIRCQYCKVGTFIVCIYSMYFQ